MENSIIGKWKLIDMTFEFFEDGTYIYTNSNSGVRTEGTYNITGNIINFPQIGGSNRYEFKDGSLYMQPWTPQRGQINAWRRI